jgi:hypothetical protein
MQIDENGFIVGQNSDSSGPLIVTTSASIEASPMLGEVALNSTSNKYKVVIYHNGMKYEWFATRINFNEFHYTAPDIWSNDTFGLKRSVKNKMKKLVEAAVCNLA